MISAYGTIVIAIFVLYLGKLLNSKIKFLRKYNIPEPVTGGIIASLISAIVYFAFDFEIQFTLSARDGLLITFFTTIGLSAKMETLKKGGIPLLVLMVVAVGYLFLQNIVGIATISLSGLPQVVGVLGGSVSLSGGHGTVIAWAPMFVEDYNITNALEIGLACSTFGLVLGGIVGGPVAANLIKKHKLEPKIQEERTVGQGHEESMNVNYDNMMMAILAISFSMGLGILIGEGLDQINASLPPFVCALFGGIIYTNIAPLFSKKINNKYTYKVDNPSTALISDVSLGLFLAMSLMSLQLWTLIELAGPIFILLIAQLIFIVLYVVFVVFRVMGKDYDAAVIAGGYLGLGLGATPTAIANMTAITKRFGGSAKAFLIVPLVGAFFIDITNALVIKFFLGLF
jgi:ESS family glutamate:Na+ symporter